MADIDMKKTAAAEIAAELKQKCARCRTLIDEIQNETEEIRFNWNNETSDYLTRKFSSKTEEMQEYLDLLEKFADAAVQSGN